MALPRFVDPHLDAARPHAVVRAVAPRPLPRDPRPLEAEVHGAGRTLDLPGWVGATSTTALLVLDGPLRDGPGAGVVVHEWYADDVTPATLLLGASMTKSALAHLVGLAIADGALALDDAVTDHVPELAGSAWAACSVDDVATMTTGADWVEDHRDPDGPAARLVACFTAAPAGSRALLRDVGPAHAPGSRWEYSTADSQVLDWVRERATGLAYAEALGGLWERLGCVRDAVVALDADGVALAGGGLAACAEDWLRLAALQHDGAAYGARLLDDAWVRGSSAPTRPFTHPGRLPSSITTHAGFGRHWWPLDDDGTRVTSDGSRGQLGYLDRALGVSVLKTSLWPYDDAWADRQSRDLSYLGLPLVALAAAGARTGSTTTKEQTP